MAEDEAVVAASQAVVMVQVSSHSHHNHFPTGIGNTVSLGHHHRTRHPQPIPFQRTHSCSPEVVVETATGWAEVRAVAEATKVVPVATAA